VILLLLLFDKYYGIDNDSNGEDDDNDGREVMTVIGTRVLDGRTGHDKVARTGLHSGNRLASTNILEGLVFGSSVGKAVAAGAGNGPTLSVVNHAQRAIERRLATTTRE
jgi:hypothetical protein